MGISRARLTNCPAALLCPRTAIFSISTDLLHFFSRTSPLQLVGSCGATNSSLLRHMTCIRSDLIAEVITTNLVRLHAAKKTMQTAGRSSASC